MSLSSLSLEYALFGFSRHFSYMIKSESTQIPAPNRVPSGPSQAVSVPEVPGCAGEPGP